MKMRGSRVDATEARGYSGHLETRFTFREASPSL